MIKLVVVDDRLLHGRIAFYWSEYLKLDRIVVLNNEASEDEFTKMILGLAKPRDVYLEIEDIERGKDSAKTHIISDENVLLIVGNLFDAKKIMDEHKSLNKVNIGGLRPRPNCKELNEKASFTVEDITIIKKLLERKIVVSVRTLPQDKAIILTEEILQSLT